MNHLVEQSFQGVSRLFVLEFEVDAQRTSNKRYYLAKVEIKDYNVMISGKILFNQPIKKNKITYENIRKVATGHEDHDAAGCLLNYTNFIDNYKIFAKDLGKKQALDVDLRAIQKINFTVSLDRAGNTRIFFFLEEAKETALHFSQGAVKVL